MSRIKRVCHSRRKCSVLKKVYNMAFNAISTGWGQPVKNVSFFHFIYFSMIKFNFSMTKTRSFSFRWIIYVFWDYMFYILLRVLFLILWLIVKCRHSYGILHYDNSINDNINEWVANLLFITQIRSQLKYY